MKEILCSRVLMCPRVHVQGFSYCLCFRADVDVDVDVDTVKMKTVPVSRYERQPLNTTLLLRVVFSLKDILVF